MYMYIPISGTINSRGGATEIRIRLYQERRVMGTHEFEISWWAVFNRSTKLIYNLLVISQSFFILASGVAEGRLTNSFQWGK